jgi:hypothetical protein
MTAPPAVTGLPMAHTPADRRYDAGEGSLAAGQRARAAVRAQVAQHDHNDPVQFRVGLTSNTSVSSR